MSNDAANGFAFLYGILGSDATLLALVSGVYRDVAPTGTAPDWAIIGHQSSQDTLSAMARRLLSGNLYRIFAVGPERDDVNLRAIADRVDTLLQPGGSPLRNASYNGVLALAVYREQSLAISETVPGAAGGSAWLNLGGLYRVELAAS